MAIYTISGLNFNSSGVFYNTYAGTVDSFTDSSCKLTSTRKTFGSSYAMLQIFFNFDEIINKTNYTVKNVIFNCTVTVATSSARFRVKEGYTSSISTYTYQTGALSVGTSMNLSYTLDVNNFSYREDKGHYFTISAYPTSSNTTTAITVSNISLDVIYEAVEYVTISTSVTPEGAGTVTPSTQEVENGATATVTATPNSGYKFSHWLLDGADSGITTPTLSGTVTSNLLCTAVFVLDKINKILCDTSQPKKILIDAQEVKAVYIDTTKVYG